MYRNRDTRVQLRAKKNLSVLGNISVRANLSPGLAWQRLFRDAEKLGEPHPQFAADFPGDEPGRGSAMDVDHAGIGRRRPKPTRFEFLFDLLLTQNVLNFSRRHNMAPFHVAVGRHGTAISRRWALYIGCVRLNDGRACNASAHADGRHGLLQLLRSSFGPWCSNPWRCRSGNREINDQVEHKGGCRIYGERGDYEEWGHSRFAKLPYGLFGYGH